MKPSSVPREDQVHTQLLTLSDWTQPIQSLKHKEVNGCNFNRSLILQATKSKWHKNKHITAIIRETMHVTIIFATEDSLCIIKRFIYSQAQCRWRQESSSL